MQNQSKTAQEARYYHAGDHFIRCLLCPHACKLSEGETGKCRTRKNIEGKLVTLAYANPCALNTDPVEKKPMYHFLPGTRALSLSTAGCNLACLNCQNSEISQRGPEQTNNYQLPPEAAVDLALDRGCSSIAYTYTDPVVYYEYCYDTAMIAKDRGIKNIIVSAGYINKKPLRELCEFIDGANIDLKSFNDKTYKGLNAGSLPPVLDSLHILNDEHVILEITNLLIPGWNDNMKEIEKMCSYLVKEGFEKCPLHFSRFYPQYKLLNIAPTSRESLEKAYHIARDSGMQFVYLGNVPRSQEENTFCPSCGETLIKRVGYTITEMSVKSGKCPFCGQKIYGEF